MTTALIRVSSKFYKKLNQIKAQFKKNGVKISTTQAADAYMTTREGGRFKLKIKGVVVCYEEA